MHHKIRWFKFWRNLKGQKVALEGVFGIAQINNDFQEFHRRQLKLLMELQTYNSLK